MLYVTFMHDSVKSLALVACSAVRRLVTVNTVCLGISLRCVCVNRLTTMDARDADSRQSTIALYTELDAKCDQLQATIVVDVDQTCHVHRRTQVLSITRRRLLLVYITLGDMDISAKSY